MSIRSERVRFRPLGVQNHCRWPTPFVVYWRRSMVWSQLRLMRKLLDPQEGPNGATTAPINPWAAPAMAGTPATLVETGEPLAWATQRG